MSTAQTLEEYSKRELANVEKQRQDAIKARGGLPYMPKLEVGENLVQLQAIIPKDDIDKNGKARKIYAVKLPDTKEIYAHAVGTNSPLHREYLTYLPKAPVWLKIVRTGTTVSDTRYSVKPASKLASEILDK